jgi:hypothetical protein
MWWRWAIRRKLAAVRFSSVVWWCGGPRGGPWLCLQTSGGSRCRRMRRGSPASPCGRRRAARLSSRSALCSLLAIAFSGGLSRTRRRSQSGQGRGKAGADGRRDGGRRGAPPFGRRGIDALLHRRGRAAARRRGRVAAHGPRAISVAVVHEPFSGNIQSASVASTRTSLHPFFVFGNAAGVCPSASQPRKC